MRVDLNSKVAFICGSTSGIGRVIALEMARNGADIVLNGRSEESAREALEDIERLGRKVIFEKADLNEYQEIKKGVEDALAKLGKIDILVASGGVTGSGLKSEFFTKTDPEAYLAYAKRWAMRLYSVKAVVDHMVQRQQGNILLITTDAGRWPTPAECMAGGMGAATVMATKIFAQRLARWKIRVNAICLKAMEDTPSYNYATRQSESLAAIFKKALAKQPFPVTPEDVANAALFLCPDESNSITGQILSVNGGLSFPG